jgi:hypothetical protein
MAAKPSPFGEFVKVELGYWASLYSSIGTEQRLVRITRLFLESVLERLSVIPELRQFFVLIPEPSLERTGNVLKYVIYDRGLVRGNIVERIVSMKSHEMIDIALNVVSEGPSTFDAALLKITQMTGHSEERVEAFLERLLGIGVIRLSTGIDERCSQYSLRLRGFLATLSVSIPPHIFNALDSLLHIEEVFGNSRVEVRHTMLQEGFLFLNVVARHLSLPEISSSVVKTFLYEDVIGHAGPERSSIAPPVDELGLLARILPVFDDGLIERLVLKRAFKHIYGDSAPPVRLLSFYSRFKALPKSLLTRWWREVYEGNTDHIAVGVLRARNAFRERLQELSAQSCLEVQLGRAWLEDWISALPKEILSWSSTAHFCQRDGRDPVKWVWNRTSIGYGRHFSRFCTDDDTSSPSSILRRSVRASLQQNEVPIVDLCAILGANVNLHPTLTPYSLIYPGADVLPAEGDLKIGEISVAEREGTLRLVSDRIGEFTLCPLGLLFPPLAPPFYRFLSRFALPLGGNTSFWDLIDRGKDNETEPSVFPRLSIGRLIIERSTIKVSKSRFPLRIPDADSFDRFVKMRFAAFEQKLPSRVFLKGRAVAKSHEEGVSPEEWLTLARHAKARKPMLVDFENFQSLEAFDKALAVAGDVLTFQEVYPVPGEDGNDDLVAEWVIELC